MYGGKGRRGGKKANKYKDVTSEHAYVAGKEMHIPSRSHRIVHLLP